MTENSQLNQDNRLKCLLQEAQTVQEIISRMSYNSFLVKGWSLTLVVLSLLLGTGDYSFLVAFVTWIVSWTLDSYFLRSEKLYRALYDWLVENRLLCDDCLLEMNRDKLEKRFGNQIPSFAQAMLSKTLLAFYGFLLLLILVKIFDGTPIVYSVFLKMR